MKKLSKLEINSEKIMRNEELVRLRGGYSGGCTECDDCDRKCLGPIDGQYPTQYEAVAACQKVYNMTCYAQDCSCPCTCG